MSETPIQTCEKFETRIGAWSAIDPPRLPTVARDVEVRAQRPPHIARIHTILDGLSGSPPESGQHVVDEQRRATRRPELSLDEFIEFRQPHETNLPRACQRFMAHPYRILDIDDTGPCTPGRLAVSRRRQHLADGGHQRVRRQRPHELRTALPHKAI